MSAVTAALMMVALLAAGVARAQTSPFASACVALQTSSFCPAFVGSRVHPNFAMFLSMTVYSSDGGNTPGPVPFGTELPPPDIIAGSIESGEGFDNAFDVAFHQHAADMYQKLYSCELQSSHANFTTPLFHNTFYCALLVSFWSTRCDDSTATLHSSQYEMCPGSVNTYMRSLDSMLLQPQCQKSAGDAHLNSWMPIMRASDSNQCIDGLKNEPQCSIPASGTACDLGCPDPDLMCPASVNDANSTSTAGPKRGVANSGSSSPVQSAMTPLCVAAIVLVVCGTIALAVGVTVRHRPFAFALGMRARPAADDGKGTILSNLGQRDSKPLAHQRLDSDHISGPLSLQRNASVSISIPTSPTRSQSVAAAASTIDAAVDVVSQRGSGSIPEIYLQFAGTARRALAGFAPQLEDEIAISCGDIIYTQTVYEDGWAVGTNHTTHVGGAYPLAVFCEVQTMPLAAPPADVETIDQEQSRSSILAQCAPEEADGFSAVSPMGDSFCGVSVSHVTQDLNNMSLSLLIEQAGPGRRSTSLRIPSSVAPSSASQDDRRFSTLSAASTSWRRSKIISVSPILGELNLEQPL
ncbi:hypothetical protein RI367_002416 [Sorochytrium milnesiophthora]